MQIFFELVDILWLICEPRHVWSFLRQVAISAGESDCWKQISIPKVCVPSKIIFPEKSLSVRMSVCLSVPSVPSRPVSPKKVAETEIFVKKSCQMYFKGDKKYSVMLRY